MDGDCHGTLQKAGLTGAYAKQAAREYAGDVSPLEQSITGGQPPEKVAADVSKIADPVVANFTSGVVKGMADADFVAKFVDAWKLGDEGNRTKIQNLGSTLGGMVVDGMSASITGKLVNKLVDAALAAIMAALNEKKGGGNSGGGSGNSAAQ